MVEQLQGRVAAARVVLQQPLEELLPFDAERGRRGRHAAHAHFEHDGVVGLELVPRSLPKTKINLKIIL